MQVAWALGLVAMVAVPGQIILGALSDRVGREIVWAISCAGFAASCQVLLILAGGPSLVLQGALGYPLTALMGPIVAEIFEGPHYGAIFGLITIALIFAGAGGPLAVGFAHDLTGGNAAAFVASIFLSAVSVIAIWQAAPRQVRVVPGRVVREHGKRAVPPPHHASGAH
jgi:MFS family permease